MKRWMIALVVAALVVPLVAPQVASAKFPAERITVDGVDLAAAADGEDVLFNPWAGEFLGEAIKIRPVDLAAGAPHEVRFWADVNGDGDASVIYGFEFYPGEPGYVRLAERGEDLWELNQRTIVRPTGWYLASPEWSAFVEAHLESRSSGNPARWLFVGAFAIGAAVTVGLVGGARRRLR